jgi:hypothetical protein
MKRLRKTWIDHKAEVDKRVWEDLPSVRVDVQEVERDGEEQGQGGGAVAEAVVKVKNISVRRLGKRRVSSGLPDARLSMEELRVEGAAMSGEQVGMGGEHGGFRWLFWTGITVTVAVFLSVVLFVFINERTPEVNPFGMDKLLQERVEEYPKGEHIADILGRKDEAMDLFARFLRAESGEEIAGMIRPVEGVDFSAGGKKLAVGIEVGWTIPEDAKWEVYTNHDPVFGVLSGFLPDDRKFQAFMILEGGRLVLDWKATTGHGSASACELLAGEGDVTEIRCWLEPGLLYSIDFPESEYAAYKVQLLWEDKPVWAYARKGSEVWEKLARMFHKSMFDGEALKPAMVTLCMEKGPAGAAGNQWVIRDLLHKSWVMP